MAFSSTARGTPLLGVMGAPVSPLFPAPPLCISCRPLPSSCTTFVFYSLAVFVEPVFPPRTYSTLSAVRNTPLGLAQGFPRGYDGEEYSRDAGDLVQSLGREYPLREGMATHSSILAWRISDGFRGAWQATAHGVTGLAQS